MQHGKQGGALDAAPWENIGGGEKKGRNRRTKARRGENVRRGAVVRVQPLACAYI